MMVKEMDSPSVGMLESKTEVQQDIQTTQPSTGEVLMELAIGVSELSGTMTDLANASRSAAEEATAGAESSEKFVTEALGTISVLSSALDRTTQCSADITGTTDQIRILFDEITKVASYIRLLALNAAIEAARVSDERGQAFAVVAKEVRQLAHKTTEITKKGTEILKNLAASADETAESVRESQERINNGLVKVQEIGGRVGQIVELTKTLAANSRQTAEKLEEGTAKAEDYSRKLNVAAVAALS